MRKTLAALVMMALFLIALPIAVDAQSRCRRGRRYANRSYTSRSYAPRYYQTTRTRPSFYRRHRNLINLGIASGAGALIGGLAGGKRGALIGLGTGAGAGALYTYVLRPKKRRYYRY